MNNDLWMTVKLGRKKQNGRNQKKIELVVVHAKKIRYSHGDLN